MAKIREYRLRIYDYFAKSQFVNMRKFLKIAKAKISWYLVMIGLGTKSLRERFVQDCLQIQNWISRWHYRNQVLSTEEESDLPALKEYVEQKHYYKPLFIFVSNLLYKINLDDKGKKLVFKTLRKNKELLSGLNLKKKNFTFDIMEAIEEALSYCYGN